MAIRTEVAGCGERGIVVTANRNRHATRVLAGLHPAEESKQENLARAFLTFTQAANSLERSYSQLQAEVMRLHRELERANVELDRSLEENARVREYLAKVLERLPCGVVAANARGEIQVLNPEAEKLLGVPKDWQARGTASLPGGLQQLLGETGSGRMKAEQELSFDRDGEVRVVGVLRENIQLDGDGQVDDDGRADNDDRADAIWILRDLTEQRRVASEKEATRRSNALAEIATVLAHEIRNPLGSMELFTGLLADASSHLPETRQWITHLRAGLRALSATVNNVLQFHLQPVGQLLPADLSRLINETMDFLQPMANQRGQSIKIDNKLSAISVRADANRLKQVFLNLSLNAFRAMLPGGTLTVRLGWAPQFPGGAVRVDFCDQGRGIDKVLIPRIFEPGFTTTHGSPGLGLAVCKKVIEQHQGEIEVHSRPQYGTTFSLTLPVIEAAA
jgi:two-component system sensor histidine kinase FlrB